MELRLSAVRFAPWLLLATLSVCGLRGARSNNDGQLLFGLLASF